MSSDLAFLRQLAEIVINVAERPPGLRGPYHYDDEAERELQERAVQARRYLGRSLSPKDTKL